MAVSQAMICHIVLIGGISVTDYPWLPSPANATGFLGWLYLPVFRPVSVVQQDSFPDLKPQNKWLLVGEWYDLVEYLLVLLLI